MRGPEGKIQDKLASYMKFHKIKYKKNEVGRYFVASGWLDFNIFPGNQRVFFMEVKAPGGKLTPLQEHRKRELEADGYHCYVVSSVEHGKMIIDKECGL